MIAGEKKEEVKKTGDVDPMCKNASNPFHKCSDYCFRGSTGSCCSQLLLLLFMYL